MRRDYAVAASAEFCTRPGPSAELSSVLTEAARPKQSPSYVVLALCASRMPTAAPVRLIPELEKAKLIAKPISQKTK